MNTAIERLHPNDIEEEKLDEKLKRFSYEVRVPLGRLIENECINNPFSKSDFAIGFNQFVSECAKVPFKQFSDEEIKALFFKNDLVYSNIKSRRNLAIERFSLDRRIYLKDCFYGLASGLLATRLIDMSVSISIRMSTDCFIDYILFRNIEL